MFKDTKEGQTNFCLACEYGHSPNGKKKLYKHTCGKEIDKIAIKRAKEIFGGQTKDLSEEDKDKDREQVMRYWYLIKS